MATPELPCDPDLSVEPVLGWRVWRLERRAGRLTLVSVTRDDPWPAQEPMRAACQRGHTSPALGCVCGIYAAGSPEDLGAIGILQPSTTVVGAVAMWGTVVEHRRGARSSVAYPARLRLVCGPCLSSGAGAVEAAAAADRGGPVIVGCRRHRPAGPGTKSAEDLQAELLSTYAVDLLPIDRVARAMRRPRIASPATGARRTARSRNPLELVAIAIFAVLRFAIGAVMTLTLLAWALAIGGAVIGGVVHAFTADARPSAAVSAAATPHPRLLDAPPRDAARRYPPHHRVLPQPIPRFAIVCGVQDGRAIRLLPSKGCLGIEGSLLGFAEQTPPKGARHDCASMWDAYSKGDDFSVCWTAFSGPHVRPWATSPDPFTTPKDEGGTLHGDR
ncbi:MAG: hypothetical protein ACM3OO_01895 [Planctomycetaceae bacterium]